MKMRTLLVVLGLVVGLLAGGASSAHAGKGVKKKGAQTISGTVVHVAHGNQKGAKHHEITIKAHHHKKKVQSNTTPAPKVAGKTSPKLPVQPNPAVPAVPGQTVHHHHHHKFTVGSDTQFYTSQNKAMEPTTFSAVHKGEHVTITAKGHHAEKVVIHNHKKQASPKKPTKKPTKK
jgi:hypothetical protein